jgi:predicted P-loop ATPase
MNNLKRVTKEDPCPHCEKPDWCYSIGELSVCKREADPATGWHKTDKTDSEGTPYYAPIQETEVKPTRPIRARAFYYTDSDNNPLIKVVRKDFGDGRKKDIKQQHWTGKDWVWGYGDTDLSKIALYQWEGVEKAKAKGERIFLVEGEPKAEALKSLGLTATCNVGGSGKWRSHYSQSLANARIVLVPDRDKPGVKHCQKVTQELLLFNCQVEWLYPKPNSAFWAWQKLPPSDGLDILDWIEEDGATLDDILGAIQPEQRSDHAQPVQTTKPLQDPLKITYFNDGDISRKLQDWELLEFFEELGDRVSFDDLKGQIVLDGEILPVDDGVKFWFLTKFKLRASKQDIKDGLIWAAKRNAFNPIKRYLENCVKIAKPCDIDDIATRYFGRSEPIYNRMVKMWVISAIARALDPGCQVDHTLILQSPQGKYKSTWFKVLGGEWFSDSLKDIDNKDSLLMLHSNWILEFSELDRVTSRKQAGTIKHFLTQRTDHFRKPYGYEIEENSRRAVFCGTVNPSRFLVDDENRRFWIIPVSDAIKEIDIPLVQQERDGIWAAAYLAYKKGERWWPDETDRATIALLNRDFKEVDEWEKPIEDYIEELDYVSTYQLLTHCLGFEDKEIKRSDSMRAAKILDELGWNKESRKDIDGHFRKIRFNPNKVCKVSKVGKSIDTQAPQDYPPHYPPSQESVNSDQSLPTYTPQEPTSNVPQTLTPSGLTDVTHQNTYFPMSQKNTGEKMLDGDRVPEKIKQGNEVYLMGNKTYKYTVVWVGNGKAKIQGSCKDRQGIVRTTEGIYPLSELSLVSHKRHEGNGHE